MGNFTANNIHCLLECEETVHKICGKKHHNWLIFVNIFFTFLTFFYIFLHFFTFFYILLHFVKHFLHFFYIFWGSPKPQNTKYAVICFLKNKIKLETEERCYTSGNIWLDRYWSWVRSQLVWFTLNQTNKPFERRKWQMRAAVLGASKTIYNILYVVYWIHWKNNAKIYIESIMFLGNLVLYIYLAE